MSGTVISLGIDLVDLDRIRKLTGKSDRFAKRICTPAEWAYCSSHRDPVPCLAARFAAKEAVAKALGTGIGSHCSFREIEVLSSPSGAPSIILHGKAAETAAQQGIKTWAVSLTHSRQSAAAVAMGMA